jgi:MYXO-CTERM domain-containing protein
VPHVRPWLASAAVVLIAVAGLLAWQRRHGPAGDASAPYSSFCRSRT